MDEKSIILRAQDGDSESFALLVEKYQDAVFTVCFSLLKNYHDANDAAQNTFIKAYKNVKRFKFVSNIYNTNRNKHLQGRIPKNVTSERKCKH